MFKIFSHLRGFTFFNFETYCHELALCHAGVNIISCFGDSSCDGNGCGFGDVGSRSGDGDGSGDCELSSRFFTIEEANDNV